MPEIVLGVAMFVVVALVLQSIPLGTWAQLEGLGPTKCPTQSSSFGRGCLSIGKSTKKLP
jgi:hypothetical protein